MMDFSILSEHTLHFQSENLAAFRYPGSDHTIVSFASMGVENDKIPFEFMKTFKNMHVNVVFIKDPSLKWYNHGIEGIGPQVSDVVSQLKRLFTEMGTQRVTTTGASMGGYGAILYGCLLHAQHVVAFAPQTVITMEDRAKLHDKRWKRDLDNAVPYAYGDLAEVIAQAPDTCVRIYAGDEDILDLLHAQHVLMFPTFNLVGVEGAVHEVALTLKRAGRLNTIFETIHQDQQFPQEEFIHQSNPRLMRHIQRIYALHMETLETDDNQYIRLYEEAVMDLPQWAAGLHHLGTLYLNSKQYKPAHETLQRVIDLEQPNAKLKNFAMHKAGLCLTKLGKRQEAITLFEQMAQEPNPPLGVYSSLFQLYREDGNYEAAAAFMKPIQERDNRAAESILADLAENEYAQLQPYLADSPPQPKAVQTESEEQTVPATEAPFIAPETPAPQPVASEPVAAVPTVRIADTIPDAPPPAARVQAPEDDNQENLGQQILSTPEVEVFQYPGATLTVLACTSLEVRIKAHEYDFFKSISAFPVNKVFIRQPRLEWYNNLVRGLGENLDETVPALRKIIEDLGTETLVTVGSSMGGWGAILFGCHLNAKHVVALAPQTFIRDELRDAYGDTRWPIPLGKLKTRQVEDLLPLVQEHPNTQIDIYFGHDDFYDLFHEVRLKVHDKVNLISVPGGHHEVGLPLKRQGYLSKILADAFTGKGLSHVVPELGGSFETKCPEVFAFAQRWIAQQEQSSSPDKPEAIIEAIESQVPAWAGGQCKLGDVYFRAYDYAKAIPQLEKGLAAVPPESRMASEAMNQLGISYRRVRRFDESIAILEKGLQYYPRSTGLLYQTGESYMAVKNYDKAETYFLKSLEVNPRYTGTLYQLGLLYIERQDYTQATEYFQRNLDVNPKHVWSLYHMAKIQQTLGDIPAAKTWCEQAMAINANHMQAKMLLKELEAVAV
jgi:tetratricopeptide (TPR) repeat protein